MNNGILTGKCLLRLVFTLTLLFCASFLLEKYTINLLSLNPEAKNSIVQSSVTLISLLYSGFLGILFSYQLDAVKKKEKRDQYLRILLFYFYYFSAILVVCYLLLAYSFFSSFPLSNKSLVLLYIAFVLHSLWIFKRVFKSKISFDKKRWEWEEDSTPFSF